MYVDERDGPKGRPFRHVLFRVAIAVLTVAIAACSSGELEGDGTPSTTPSVKLSVYRLGVKAPTAKGSVVVYTYDGDVPATASAKPQDGNKFVAIDVEGCAGKNADENTGIDPLLFYLQFQAEPLYPVDPGVKEPALHKTALAPGGCKRGWVTFSIPTDVTPQYAFFRTTGRIAWLLTPSPSASPK